MQHSRALLVFTVLGFAFLYVPIAIMIVYSFNASRLVTVWGGFSTRWYAELLDDGRLVEAAWLSIMTAAASATLSVVLGALAAIAIARKSRRRTRGLLLVMVTAPLVMPEVVTGLSLLLLFIAMEVSLGWPAGRGVTTIVIAHATFGMAFVAVVVQARLKRMDRSIEEAAADLGAPPWRVFTDITLPAIAPALVAGWLLAFTLSIDDLVIASFVSGPGSSTLPMIIFSKVRLGVSPDINALATLLILIVSLGVVAAAVILRLADRRERQRH